MKLKITHGNCLDDDSGKRIAIALCRADSDYRKNTALIATAVNACHGLDLPANVTPGVMELIVNHARGVIDAWEGGNLAEAVRGLAAALDELNP